MTKYKAKTALYLGPNKTVQPGDEFEFEGAQDLVAEGLAEEVKAEKPKPAKAKASKKKD